jgi:hypothetical protein
MNAPSSVSTHTSEIKHPEIRVYLETLQSASRKIFEASLAGENLAAIGRSYHFGSELSSWAEVLCARREAELMKIATHEYGFAILALSQGHYRHAFKALRLVLELCLQAAYLSANELKLRDWLSNRRDTSWNAIIAEDADDAIFSVRFANAFFPELKPHLPHYRSLAAKVYRECSECVHGNVPTLVPLPKKLEFDQPIFDLWHEKAETSALVIHFALTLRYFNEVNEADRDPIEPALAERLGYVPEIRTALGGRAT